MSWRNEPQSKDRPLAAREPAAPAICLTFAVLFLLVSASTAAFSAYATLSNPLMRACSPEEQLRVFWQEFQYGSMWPLAAAGVSFGAWRVLKKRSKDRSDVT